MTQAPPSPGPLPSSGPAGPVDPTALGPLAPGAYEAFGLGPLRGPVAFTMGSLVLADQEAYAQLWAIPLSGESPKLAARFRGGAGDLPRQLAPDGKRIVLNLRTPRNAGGDRASLVILELETGTMRLLGRDDRDSDLDPAWSPTGRQIAYVRVPDQWSGSLDDGIWVINEDGSGVRQIVPGRDGQSTRLHGWIAEGTHLAFTYSGERTYTIVDVTSKAQLRVGSGYTADVDDSSYAWRTRSPRFAGVFVEQTGCVPRYVGVSDAGGDFSIVVREPGTVGCAGSLRNVRWHPSDDALLYFRDSRDIELRETTVSGTQRAIPVQRRPEMAEWVPPGYRILYAALPEGECCFAGDIRVIGRDGTGERVVFGSTVRLALFGLAVHSYP